jgi:hypothetical protein
MTRIIGSPVYPLREAALIETIRTLEIGTHPESIVAAQAFKPRTGSASSGIVTLPWEEYPSAQWALARGWADVNLQSKATHSVH